MRKTMIYFLLFIVMIGIANFVYANSMIGGNDSPYTVEADVFEGWNIIAGILPSQAILSDSKIKSSNIKAVWYYALCHKVVA